MFHAGVNALAFVILLLLGQKRILFLSSLISEGVGVVTQYVFVDRLKKGIQIDRLGI